MVFTIHRKKRFADHNKRGSGRMTGDWDKREEGVELRVCERCGIKRGCRFTTDAYTEEVWPEVEPTEWLCYDCYMENVDDV